MSKAIAHRRGAERAEKKFLYKKTLRALRLCGKIYKKTGFLDPACGANQLHVADEIVMYL